MCTQAHIRDLYCYRAAVPAVGLCARRGLMSLQRYGILAEDTSCSGEGLVCFQNCDSVAHDCCSGRGLTCSQRAHVLLTKCCVCRRTSIVMRCLHHVGTSPTISSLLPLSWSCPALWTSGRPWWVCMCVRACMRVRLRKCLHVRAQVCLRTYVCISVHVCACARTCLCLRCVRACP